MNWTQKSNKTLNAYALCLMLAEVVYIKKGILAIFDHMCYFLFIIYLIAINLGVAFTRAYEMTTVSIFSSQKHQQYPSSFRDFRCTYNIIPHGALATPTSGQDWVLLPPGGECNTLWEWTTKEGPQVNWPKWIVRAPPAQDLDAVEDGRDYM